MLPLHISPFFHSQCVCVGALALPVGLHLVSRGSIPRPLTALLSPAMADCTTTQPVLSDIVARADQLYEDNKMREGLSYLKQCKHLDEVEVTLLALTTPRTITNPSKLKFEI